MRRSRWAFLTALAFAALLTRALPVWTPVYAAGVTLNSGGAGTNSKLTVTSGVGSATSAYALGSASNTVVIVGIATNGNTTMTSVVWDAAGANQAFTLKASEQENSFVRFAYLYCLTGASTGSKTVTVTPGASDTIDVAIIAFDGADTSSGVTTACKDPVQVNGGSSPTLSVTTANGDATVADIISNGGSLTITSGTQWWNDTNLGGHYSAGGYHLSTTTSDTYTWTQGFADVWGAAGIHIPASGGGASTKCQGSLGMLGVSSCGEFR